MNSKVVLEYSVSSASALELFYLTSLEGSMRDWGSRSLRRESFIEDRVFFVSNDMVSKVENPATFYKTLNSEQVPYFASVYGDIFNKSLVIGVKTDLMCFLEKEVEDTLHRKLFFKMLRTLEKKDNGKILSLRRNGETFIFKTGSNELRWVSRCTGNITNDFVTLGSYTIPGGLESNKLKEELKRRGLLKKIMYWERK